MKKRYSAQATLLYEAECPQRTRFEKGSNVSQQITTPPRRVFDSWYKLIRLGPRDGVQHSLSSVPSGRMKIRQSLVLDFRQERRRCWSEVLGAPTDIVMMKQAWENPHHTFEVGSPCCEGTMRERQSGFGSNETDALESEALQGMGASRKALSMEPPVIIPVSGRNDVL